MVILKNKEYDSLIDSLHEHKKTEQGLTDTIQHMGDTYREQVLTIRGLRAANQLLNKKVDTMRNIDQLRLKAQEQRDFWKGIATLYQQDLEVVALESLCAICSEPNPEKCGATCNFRWRHQKEVESICE